MCHPILFGILGGIIAAKVIRAIRWRRMHGGGACAGAHGCGGHGFRRWGRFGGRGSWNDAPVVRLSDLDDKLELNARQKQEAQSTFAKLAAQFGDAVGRASEAKALLAIVAGEPFDAGAALEIAGSKELVDGLEHVHNILTTEQRDRLRDLLDGPPPPSPTASV